MNQWNMLTFLLTFRPYWSSWCFLQADQLPPETLQHQHSILTDLSPSTRPLIDRMLEIEELICGEVCGTRLGFPGSGNKAAKRYPSCQTCHCDAVCSMFRDCCPDVLLKDFVEYEKTPTNLQCIEMVPVPYNRTKKKDVSNVVVSCPFSLVNQTNLYSDNAAFNDTVEKCSNLDVTQPDQSLLVTSTISGFTYRNKFCAKCHNDTSDLETWASAIICEGQPSELMSRSNTKLGLFQTVTSAKGVNSTGCELHYISANEYLGRECSQVSSHVISSCNVTGQWHFYDQELVEACAMYTSIFLTKYRNMFCYMCNSHVTSLEDIRLMVHNYLNDVAIVSFSALFDFHETNGDYDVITSEGNTNQTSCDGNSFYDPVSCTCKTPSCSEGKYLKSSRQCQSLVKSNILGYHFCADAALETDMGISIEEVGRFILDFWGLRMTHLKWEAFSVRQWCPGDEKIIVNIEVFISLFSFSGYLEDLELSIDRFFQNMTLLAKMRFKTDNINSTISFTDVCPVNNVTYPCNTNKSIYFRKTTIALPMVNKEEDKKIHFIKYSHSSLCPFLVFDNNELSRVYGTDYYSHHLSKELIHKSKIDAIDKSLFRLCVSDYLTLTEDYTGVCRINSDNSDTWTVSGLVSVICTCISLFCFLLTFITYIILDPLRSEGGKNIMTLTVVEFFAQAFYEFAIEQYENTNVCKTFGIIIHYSWMAAVFSMNACTVERFCKLCFPLESRSFFLSKKPFILSTGYTLFCPFVIVSLNVIVNQMTRGDIGYGSSTLCFINTPMSRILAFALPMATLILVNLGLFLITVWSLQRRKSSRSKFRSANKVSLGACVRLSIVTGMTWLLAFLYDVISSEYLDYVITAFLGLQGVMFFFSLVVNRRVIGLYKALLLSQKLCSNQFKPSSNIIAEKLRHGDVSKSGMNNGESSTSSDSGKGISTNSSNTIQVSTVVTSNVSAHL